MLILEIALGIVLGALFLAFLPYVIGLLLLLLALGVLGLIVVLVATHWSEWGPAIRAFGGFALAISAVCAAVATFVNWREQRGRAVKDS